MGQNLFPRNIIGQEQQQSPCRRLIQPSSMQSSHPNPAGKSQIIMSVLVDGSTYQY